MRRKRLSPGMLLLGVLVAFVGCLVLLLYAMRSDTSGLGYAMGPFLAVVAPWPLVALGLYLFFPKRPDVPSGAKPKSKADPLDL